MTIRHSIYNSCRLHPDKATTRVLQLQPGRENDAIQAEFQLVDLYDIREPYDCVSYVWGDSTVTRPVLVNGYEFQVTTNLYNALRHIRSQSETIRIWADAICINQSDLDEKSEQVTMMTRIYRQCSTVHIWLGLPSPENVSWNPFSFLEQFLQGRHLYEFPGFHRNTANGPWLWESDAETDRILDGFLQVVESPWWTRAWTVQEWLLPNRAVLMLGTWKMTWTDVLAAVTKRDNHYYSQSQCCSEASRCFSPQQIGSIESWMQYPAWAKRVHDLLSQENFDYPSFNQILLACADRQCSDPRDKIYSMMAFKPLDMKPISPGYRRDTTELYATVFTTLFQEIGREIDSYICLMGGAFGSCMPGLPSWVRDYSQNKTAKAAASEERRVRYAHLYEASCQRFSSPGARWTSCKGWTAWRLESRKQKSLQHMGAHVDTIAAVGPCMLSSHKDDIGAVLHEWLALCSIYTFHTDASFLDTFMRVICADVCGNVGRAIDTEEFRRATKEDLPTRDAWQRLISGDLHAVDPQGYGAGLHFALWGRCFFTTRSGRMGLCYPNAMQGDEVWILGGACVPFMVRPRSLKRYALPDFAPGYLLVGDCFLHGIMDRELAEEEMREERLIVFW